MRSHYSTHPCTGWYFAMGDLKNTQVDKAEGKKRHCRKQKRVLEAQKRQTTRECVAIMIDNKHKQYTETYINERVIMVRFKIKSDICWSSE